MADDIMKLDLYEIIGAEITSTESEIKKAYRKKALECHPDKNPDNPKAAELFLQLSKALEILTDPAAKAAYDKVLKAKAEAKLRVKELSAKRQKLKDNLEAREEAFRRTQQSDYDYSSKTDEEKLRAEIERLKKEGSRLVEEEKERVRQKILEELRLGSKNACYSENDCRIKVNWKADPDDETNGGYTKDVLHRILSKHGEISALVMSKKNGSALVEYQNKEAADSAVKYELGLAQNKLKLKGMWDKSKGSQQLQSNSYESFSSVTFPSTLKYSQTKSGEISEGLSFSSAPDIFNTKKSEPEGTGQNKLSREEERRRLIAQLQAEDDGT